MLEIVGWTLVMIFIIAIAILLYVAISGEVDED